MANKDNQEKGQVIKDGRPKENLKNVSRTRWTKL